MPSPSPAHGTPSLRDQLCQIEQSLGVCHIAEVQLWPGGPGGRPSGPRPPSARVYPPGTPRSPSSGRPHSARPNSAARVRAAMDAAAHSPAAARPAGAAGGSPGERGGGAGGRSCRASPGKPPAAGNSPGERGGALSARGAEAARRWGNAGRSPRQAELDGDVARHLERAVAKLLDEEDRARPQTHPAASGDNACVSSLPQIVSLGPPSEPSIALVCGRLPQQLADFRFQLRTLGSYVDSLQATLASARERGACQREAGQQASLESLEEEHSSTMGQAKLLLSTGLPRCASECSRSAPGEGPVGIC